MTELGGMMGVVTADPAAQRYVWRNRKFTHYLAISDHPCDI
jgi:hypothetical protein